jgi:hypothetical protein
MGTCDKEKKERERKNMMLLCILPGVFFSLRAWRQLLYTLMFDAFNRKYRIILDKLSTLLLFFSFSFFLSFNHNKIQLNYSEKSHFLLRSIAHRGN